MRIRLSILLIVLLNALASNLCDAGALGEPSFAEILQAAFRQERLGWEGLSKMERKMRVAPWLPTLYAGYDLSLRATSAVSITDNISVTSSSVTVGPDDNDWDQSAYRSDVLHFKAIWNLNELVFHPSALAHAREMRSLGLDRLKFTDYLSKIHAERRKTVVEYLSCPERSAPKALLLREKIRTLTEEVDAHTGNAFSTRWRKY